jgi:hypothetical protein
LVDLDGDGKTDILSGSWPGPLYWFRRQTGDAFAPGVELKNRDGALIDVGRGTTPFAVDWDGDSDLDLIVGNLIGEIYVLTNEGMPRLPAFGAPERILVDGKPIKIREGDAAPVVADWDADGRVDLVVGTEAGSVLWFRNAGTSKTPALQAPITLVPESPLGFGSDSARRSGEWGVRVKVCVTDWNGDGRLDLLLGDRCGGFNARPVQSDDEKSQERTAFARLPELRTAWARAFQQYRSLQAEIGGDHQQPAQDQRESEFESLRRQVVRLKEEISAAQKVAAYYQPQAQSHGFVWLFQRKPAAK